MASHNAELADVGDRFYMAQTSIRALSSRVGIAVRFSKMPPTDADVDRVLETYSPRDGADASITKEIFARALRTYAELAREYHAVVRQG